jgi:hypothetical protein
MLLLLFYAASAFTALTVVHRLGGPLPTMIEPYAGALAVDGGERQDPFSLGSRLDGPGATDILGGRLLWPIGESWSAGIDYGYARFDMREATAGCDEGVELQCFVATTAMDMHTVFAQVRRTWSTGIVDVHATGGTGALVLKGDEADSRTQTTAGRVVSLSDVAPADFEPERELAFLLGAGVSRPLHPRVAITAEARDLIHLCRNDPDEYKERSSWFLCEDRTTLHHWQLTTGLRVRF